MSENKFLEALKLIDELRDSLSADMEHGARNLNDAAWDEFLKKYPRTIEAIHALAKLRQEFP